MENLYCLPLLCSTQAQVEEQLQRAQGDFHKFEIWLDLLDGCSDHWVQRLAEAWGSRLIFLFRRPQLAPIQMPMERRRELLDLLAATDAYVDFDLPTQRAEFEHWRGLGAASRALLSHHDYQATPPDEALWPILSEMAAHRPWICKIATFCQERSDALRLLALQLRFAEAFEDQEFLILGMGQYGIITRMVGPMWGNAMTFAPITQDAASAPGQFTRQQYAHLFSMLGGED